MRKTIVKAVAAIAVMGAMTLGVVVSTFGGSPACPNGCLADGAGCTCNGYHPHYLEANEVELAQ